LTEFGFDAITLATKDQDNLHVLSYCLSTVWRLHTK